MFFFGRWLAAQRKCQLQAWTCASLVHVIIIDMNSYTQLPCSVQKTVSFQSSLLGSYTVIGLPSENIPESWEKGCAIDVTSRTEHSLLSSPLPMDQVFISVLIAIYCVKNIFWWGLRDVLIYKNSNNSSAIGLILCPINLIIVVDSSLGPMTCVAMGSWSN